MKLGAFLNLHTNQLQMDQRLSVKHEILKLLEEKLGQTLQDRGTGKDFGNGYSRK